MFRNRKEAGQRLADALVQRGWQFDVVLGIPRGGVVVAREVADRFGCSLDVIMARKIGSPANLEYAIGAVTPDGEVLLDDKLRQFLGLEQESIDKSAQRIKQEINQRLAMYRAGKKNEPLAGRRVVLIDDGIATGFTVKAAVQYLRRQGASYIAVAVPVASEEACLSLESTVDSLFCLEVPEVFFAVGQFYQDFRSVEDEEVIRLLRQREVG